MIQTIRQPAGKREKKEHTREYKTLFNRIAKIEYGFFMNIFERSVSYEAAYSNGCELYCSLIEKYNPGKVWCIAVEDYFKETYKPMEQSGGHYQSDISHSSHLNSGKA